MLCITSITFKRKFHSHLQTLHLHIGPGHALMTFLNSNDQVVDLIYLGNAFHMCAPKTLKLFSKLCCILSIDAQIMLFMSNIW